MLKANVAEALNHQINAELYSAYLYLSMAACLESRSLTGMARWLRLQAEEELKHAMKFFEHILERNGTVSLAAIKAPPANWESPAAAFEEAYKHECQISAMIHKLAELAAAEKDHALGPLLQWFAKEQVEEEHSTHTVAERLRLAGDSSSALLLLDHELGERKADS